MGRRAMARVLVTGSAGAIGQPVCEELRRRGHWVRGLDRVLTPRCDECCVGDIAEAALVREAVAGCDAVIHLAAHPNDADFSVLLGPNVVGLYNVMNAARDAALRRVVLASSIQVVGWTRDEVPLPVSVEVTRPGNHYALTKLWAEDMGRMYADRFEMSVLAVRIAWMVRNLDEARHMQKLGRFELYLSRSDAGRFFAHAVEAEFSGFELAYAVSVEGARRYDMAPARRVLAFEARDRWPEGLGFEVPADG